jgi:Bacterial regulatory proteins, luxR family
LRCLINGDPNKIIARKIHISEATVKVHVKAILRKVRVHNRTQSRKAIWAMNNRSFMPARDNRSSTLSKRSVQPFPGQTPPSPPELEIGSSHASAGGEQLAPNDIERE